MMMNRRLAAFSLLLIGILPVGAVDYATKRLQHIAKCLALDSIQPPNNQTSYDYQYRNKTLAVRANRYGEIEHIGWALFPADLRKLAPSPIYDFLERDLLERQLSNFDGELQHKLENEHLTFVVGNANTVFSFDGTEQIAEERIDLKKYRVTWTKDDREVLKISFDMDIEMLMGCNAIELEEQFMRRLKRYEIIELPTSNLDFFPESDDFFVLQGDSFLIREMRSDLYYERTEKGWHLLNNPEMASKLLPNLMLSTQFEANTTLNLTLDKYGYGTEKAIVDYKNMLCMAMDEGCMPYFGFKKHREDGSYSGTLMLVNRRGGYVHMLSVIIPIDTIKNKGNGKLIGRLYVYIPMHNVADKYFQKNTNK